MFTKNVKPIKPSKTYVGAQGISHNAGVSRNTTDSEKVCMNILSIASGMQSTPHIYKEIETITYML